MLKSEASVPLVKLTIVAEEAKRSPKPERLGRRRIEQFLDLKAISPRTRELYASKYRTKNLEIAGSRSHWRMTRLGRLCI